MSEAEGRETQRSQVQEVSVSSENNGVPAPRDDYEGVVLGSREGSHQPRSKMSVQLGTHIHIHATCDTQCKLHTTYT